MDNINLYNDIKARTGGEIYLGIVGPVRTGKSTFIRRFMDIMVIPAVTDLNEKRRIIDELFKNNTDKDYFICSQNYFQKNTMTKYKYCILMFFEHEFEQMIQTGMNTKESLGWSGTFMKEGISFLLLLLYSGSTLPVGLQAMQSRVVSACGFEKEQYCFGTNKIVEQKQYELFNELFTKWKEDVTISEDEQNNWIHKIEKWICDRTQAIMENNRRNYYGECAGFIAALGEVMESNGEEGAKNRLLEQYRYKYSRRRAFHEELRRYGMKKIVKK